MTQGFENERFNPSLPSYIAPEKTDHLIPVVRDHSVSPSLIERMSNDGNDRIAELLLAAKIAAKEQAHVIEKIRSNKVPSKKVEAKETPIKTNPLFPFKDTDIVDDATFIKKTRSANMHDPEMKALFFANGGSKLLATGLNYAQAFDNLRRQVIARMSKPVGISPGEYRRASYLPLNSKTYVAGVPTQDEIMSRARAKEDARERKKTAHWLKQG